MKVESGAHGSFATLLTGTAAAVVTTAHYRWYHSSLILLICQVLCHAMETLCQKMPLIPECCCGKSEAMFSVVARVMPAAVCQIMYFASMAFNIKMTVQSVYFQVLFVSLQIRLQVLQYQCDFCEVTVGGSASERVGSHSRLTRQTLYSGKNTDVYPRHFSKWTLYVAKNFLLVASL